MNKNIDVIIKVETKYFQFPGSMTGLRKEIAKHVVLTILETLNENDYVNVYTFSEKTVELVPCFKGALVQVRRCLRGGGGG